MAEETVLLQQQLFWMTWQSHLEQGHVDVHNLISHPASSLHTQNVPSKHCYICPQMIDQPDVFVSCLITKSCILNGLHCANVVHGEWSKVWINQKASQTLKYLPQRVIHLNRDTEVCAATPKQSKVQSSKADRQSDRQTGRHVQPEGQPDRHKWTDMQAHTPKDRQHTG